MYIAGIDGGGSKTHCIIGDETGQILSQAYSSSSNYQVIGSEMAQKAIQEALRGAAAPLKLELSDLRYVHLGLAGADFEEDFTELGRICSEIFGDVPFGISNDCWLGLRLGSADRTGVAVVCGTSLNAAGRTPDGRECILRSQGYELGNWGGGADLTRSALHHAFRSEEATGPKTRLEAEIPEFFGYESLDAMVTPMITGQVEQGSLLSIPHIVFRLANEGDGVCQDLLIRMGRTMGEMAAGIIRRLELSDNPVNVYAIGGLVKGDNPLLMDEFRTTVHRTAPRAHIEAIDIPPAYGAYLLARDAL